MKINEAEKIFKLEIKGYSYILVDIEKVSNLGWTVPLRNKTAQLMKDFLKTSWVP